MDVIEAPIKSVGKDTRLVVLDRLTKYSRFTPLAHPFTASSIAELFFNNVAKHHGLPRSIVSNSDKIFISSFWKGLFNAMGLN